MASSEVFKAGYVINDRFEIGRLLGQGGFAMVFEGTDRNLDRKVAIKILHGAVLKSSKDDHRVIERFEREAKLAASVDHPSVVNIYDAGEIDGLGEPFIVMEYLKGDSLQDYLDENGPIEPAKLLPLFKDVLMGLGYAHELGIVHKDLKPDNIFYRYPDSMRESLCIVDFGIAHIGRSNSGRVTRDGEFFGTPSYMPPEYIAEQKVGAAFDVYQMGLILIECLTGQSVVYHEDAVATLLMHLNRQFRIPPALLESEAWPVIERAIAANPTLRYANALGFAEALHHLPATAWPSRAELAVVAVRGDAVERSSLVDDGLESLSESSDGELAEVWKQEDSYRTKGNSHKQTISSLGPAGAEVSAEDSSGVSAEQAASRREITDELPYADGAPSLIESFSTQKSSRLGVIAGVLLLLVVLAGGAIVMLSQPESSGGTAPDTTNVMAAVNEEAPVKVPDEVTTPVVVEDPVVEPRPIEEAPKPVKVEISGEPAGALISSRGGEILGLAPWTMTFDSEQSNGQILIISRKGYEDAELQVFPTSSPADVTYTLKALRKPSPQKKQDNVAKNKPEKVADVKVELPNTTPAKKPPGSGILLPN